AVHILKSGPLWKHQRTLKACTYPSRIQRRLGFPFTAPAPPPLATDHTTHPELLPLSLVVAPPHTGFNGYDRQTVAHRVGIPTTSCLWLASARRAGHGRRAGVRHGDGAAAGKGEEALLGDGPRQPAGAWQCETSG